VKRKCGRVPPGARSHRQIAFALSLDIACNMGLVVSDLLAVGPGTSQQHAARVANLSSYGAVPAAMLSGSVLALCSAEMQLMRTLLRCNSNYT
jgi:hypothetical protein